MTYVIVDGWSEREIYEALDQWIGKLALGGDILDFGAGVGNFLKTLESKNHFRTVTGADAMARAEGLRPSTKWIVSDLNQPLPLPENQFDVVLSSEVIEHLENPRAVVREWFRLLRPGGCLIMSTPNNESWRSLLALLFRGAFVAFGEKSYPAHISALLRVDIRRILNETDFILKAFDYTDHGTIPKLSHCSWQQISGGLLKGKRFSDNILAIAHKPL